MNSGHRWNKSVGSELQKRLTVESLGFGEEPFKPASLDIHLVELLKGSPLVYLRVMGELGTLDEAEDDCVLEPSQDGADPIEGEGIPGEHIVGLHGWLPGRAEERVFGGMWLFVLIFYISGPFRSSERSRAASAALAFAAIVAAGYR